MKPRPPLFAIVSWCEVCGPVGADSTARAAEEWATCSFAGSGDRKKHRMHHDRYVFAAGKVAKENRDPRKPESYGDDNDCG